MTPSGTPRYNLKPTGRKLWNSDKLQLGEARPAKKYSKSRKDDRFDEYLCPQFVDFTDATKIGDSFFAKHGVIASTPEVNKKPGPSTYSINENTQIESLEAFSLSCIDIAPPEKKRQTAEDINVSTMEHSVNNIIVIPVETNEPKNRMEMTEALKTPTSTTGFHSRDKCKQDNEHECNKKNLEEDKSPWVLPEKETNLKSSARKVWQDDKLQLGKPRTSQEYINSGKDEGGKIVGPQFVDFANLPKIDDSSFGKYRVIVSTPKVDGESKSFTHSLNENTIIESLEAFCLSCIDIAPPQKTGQTAEDSVSTMEHSVNNITVIPVQTNEPKNRIEVNKQLKIATSAARCHCRDESKQHNKPQRIKKNLEEDKKQFRAKPLPKYLIARKMELNKNNNNNAEKIDCDVDGKERKLQSLDKNKENREVWKKPPFVPCPSQKNGCTPKSPPLRTKGRAEERKKFDQNVKGNEMKVKLQKQKDLEAKREQEEKEIALLRKQTVHKAQPIRKYKETLPRIQKRPLTDPQTPLTLKRRRV